MRAEVRDGATCREPGAPPVVGRVTGLFRNLAPVVLWLTLSTGQVIGLTPEHEVWTHQAGWTIAEPVSPGHTLVGLDGQPVTVASVALDRTPRPVYNLEVDGTSTFFAEGVWVHNSACRTVIEAVGWLWHHTVPDAVLKKMRDENPTLWRQVMQRGASKKGRDALLFEIPEDVHRAAHGAVGVRGYSLPGGQWNTAWWNEIEAKGGLRGITLDELWGIRGRLLEAFDLLQYAK